MNYRKIKFILVLSFIAFSYVHSQEDLSSIEMQLKKLHGDISFKNSDNINININDSIFNMLERALKLPGSIDYPFDSLNFIGKITSPDKKTRAITWNLQTNNGYKYFGFIQRRTGGEESEVFVLFDKGYDIVQPEKTVLKSDQWYGCLIYNIIERKIEGDSYYFYLGYRPESIFSNKKLIDVFWFQDKNLFFGKPVFDYKKSINHRIIFQYSAKAQMMLKWNENLKMIVFDHLVPAQSSQAGNYQFYVPDLSYDGLMFEKDFWITKENLELRN